ncbi:Trypsin [Popillia japonica]|uniref:Trypsin n=1 Tax=Popillia japonica TaxID=7064 RepID=A0AAW1MY83_POPJA
MTRLLTFKFVLLPILYFTIILSEKINAQRLESPCPNVFVYEQRGREADKWFGTVTLLSTNNVVEKRINGSEQNRELVRRKINATTTPPPYIGSPYPDDAPPASSKDDFFPGDFAGFKVGPTSIESNVECGTLAIQPTPLITHGRKTKIGEFPWHAALYHTRSRGLNYTCGGSLISRYHVLTAAHCVSKPVSQTLLNPENILVYLGKYYLKVWSIPDIQSHHVSKITRHPQYNFEKFANDIAVIRLSNRAEFTDVVRPICLWQGPKDIDHLIGKLGTVVGWGYDEDGKLTEELTKLEMPVVSKEVCIYSLLDFYSSFTTVDTYCAGFLNGTTTCNGDSGGGMVFQRDTENPNKNVYHLRGLISLSVALQNEAKCDPKHYVVLTDVAKYLEFIEEAMTQ